MTQPPTDALHRLRACFSTQPNASLGAITDELGPQGQALLLLLLGAASLVPGPAPIFGAALCALGLGMLLGRTHLALPSWIRRREVSTTRTIALLERIVPVITRFAHPRYPRLLSGPAMRVIGAACLIGGTLIVLPIPFGNAAPALAIMVLAVGILTGDGAIVAAGLAASALSVALSVFLITIGVEAVTWFVRNH